VFRKEGRVIWQVARGFVGSGRTKTGQRLVEVAGRETIKGLARIKKPPDEGKIMKISRERKDGKTTQRRL